VAVGDRNTNRGRIDRLRFSFAALHADALLVSHLPNIRYLCGFSGSAGLLLVEQSRSTLFTDSRYTFQAREEVSGARVRIATKGLLRGVGEALRSRRGRIWVAYSSGHVTVTQMQALKRASGSRVRWVGDTNSVENLRVIKDADELARMRAAADLISKVFIQVVPAIKPGVTELDLAAEIEYAMKRRGATGPSFDTIVASGARTAWAHAQPTPKPLKKSELVVMDQGAILRGYCSDMTRTVFLGRAPKNVRRLYGAVLEAQQAAKRAIGPGVTAGAVDAAARSVLRRQGLARYFTHSTGHGLGLEVHEMPRIGRGEDYVLREGMVLTVEPGVYIRDVGGIRIEDDVVVTAKGAIDLTTAPRDFLEL
jgi:Xaa-Pro aminopeptidase